MEARSRTSGDLAGGRIEIREAARRPSLDGSREGTAGPGAMLRCDSCKGTKKQACLGMEAWVGIARRLGGR